MGFFLQLKLLVWKNFILRKRQKIRLFVELIWPLFLFLILAWVRTRGLRLFVHECHFEEKAMPSAGQIPFLQSFFCTFNNTCHETLRSGELNSTMYSDSILTQMLKDMQQLLENETTRNQLKSMRQVSEDLRDMSELVTNITSGRQTPTGSVNVNRIVMDTSKLRKYVKENEVNVSDDDLNTLLDSQLDIQKLSLDRVLSLRSEPRTVLCDKNFISGFVKVKDVSSLDNTIDQLCSQSNVPLTDLIELSSEGVIAELFDFTEHNLQRSLNWEQWRQLNTLSRQLTEDLTVMDGYQSLVKSSSKAGEEYQTLLSTFKKKNVTDLYANFMIAQRFFCGHEMEEILEHSEPGSEQSERIDTIRERLKKLNRATYDYWLDADASPECNRVFRMLDGNTMTRFIWLQIKPTFRGKILYFPNTEVTQRIMRHVNSTFDSVLKAREMVKYWGNVTLPSARELLVENVDNLRIIKEFMDSEQGKRLLEISVNNDVVNSFYRTDGSQRMQRVNSLLEKLLDYNDTLREETFRVILDAQRNISSMLECFETNKIEGYDSEEEAERRGMDLIEYHKLWALVSFQNIDTNSTVLPPFISYKIRMDSSRVDGTDQIEDRLERPGPRRRASVDLKYLTNGFAYLQDMIESSIITEQTGRQDTPGLFLQQFPYPCYIIDRFALAISRTFPMFMTLSWVYSCAMIIKSIVYEKEKRLKETMRIMGLGNGVHWIGWFVDSIVPMFITVVVLTIILVYGKVLENSDPSLVFIFLMLYCIATIAKSFLISVFFSRANLAAAAGGIIFFVLYLPYPFMVIWEQRLSSRLKVISSMLSNVAFGFGCSYFAHYEEMGLGLHWGNFGKSPVVDDTYNMSYVLCMLIFDAVLYFVLTWYIEAVFPGDYGVPKPWYFPVMKTYWCGSQASVEPLDSEQRLMSNQIENGNFEEEPKHLNLGVSVCNLGKMYDNGKVAVHKLNLNFYENQITSFLGHNGAGKTTTISILTGLLCPTAGTAKIYGLDIHKDMDTIRKSLGTCPQHNVLFDQLSVEEHLWFYARLKERPTKEVIPEIEQMLNDLGLPEKRKSLASQLSGGMQRKLSIAAAFIGGSRTVILDEPTSGVDPFSRRSIWELLIKYKQGRTVILTTHFMDEADLLGDRIAIIANGQLQCCGTSLFLKSKFGLGYYLTIEQKENILTSAMLANGVSQCNGWTGGTHSNEHTGVTSEDITHVIQCHVPSARLIQHLGCELMYLLPGRENIHVFEQLFNSLDENMNHLGISSYGITDTTLEEIFLSVAEQAESTSNGVLPADDNYRRGKTFKNFFRKNIGLYSNPRYEEKQQRHDTETTEVLSSNIVESKKKEIIVRFKGSKLTYHDVPISMGTTEIQKFSWILHWRQFVALNVKRFHSMRRNPKALFSELVLPALFVCLSLAFTVVLPHVGMPQPLTLQPWMYGPPNYVFFSNENSKLNWTKKYEEELTASVGMGTRCVNHNGKKNGNCKPGTHNMNYTSVASEPQKAVECSCAKGTPSCPSGAAGPTPPHLTASTGDIILNLTNRNVSDWLVKTTEEYRKKRYGGFSFGVNNPFRAWNFDKMAETFNKINPYEEGDEETEFIKSASEYIEPVIKQMDTQDNIRIWFNNKGWTSSVSYMNAVNNIVLRASLPPDKNKDDYGIQVINHPMNYTRFQLAEELMQQSGISLLHAISVIFALSFVPASFVVFLIEERESNAKHLQFVSGVNRTVYWIATYCWDFGCYLIAVILCIFIFLAFDEQAYVSKTNMPGLVLLLVLYGWSSIPLMYPASFIFSVPSSAFVATACANLFIGIVTTVATFVLEIFDDEELQYIASIIRQVFLVFPHFCLGQGLMNLAAQHYAAAVLYDYGMELDADIFEWDFIGKNIGCMFITGVVFFLFNLCIEYEVFFYLISLCQGSGQTFDDKRPLEEEEDVAAERQKVMSGNTNDDILSFHNLTKMYGDHCAVNHLCVSIKKGECFGLLGLNGAGKTSTFKMLTGDIKVSYGDAYVAGYSIRSQMDNVRRHLGYCPQFDALNPLLTVREHLQLYSRLRGVPNGERNACVDACLKKLNLENYADRLAGTLSGGNKRKLSTAIALIGDPPLLFMDEPTTGMDPKARRFLWSCIQDVVASGRSVVLTSHSMEECEALCTKLTVMVNGTFRCLGSSQHLKNKFGQGYMLTVRCKSNTQAAVANHVSSHLPSATVREVHHNQVQYEIPQNSVKLADVFRVMEEARAQELLEDYSLCQTTLEEVFIKFANEQGAEQDMESTFCKHFNCVHYCRCCFGSSQP